MKRDSLDTKPTAGTGDFDTRGDSLEASRGSTLRLSQATGGGTSDFDFIEIKKTKKYNASPPQRIWFQLIRRVERGK